MSCANLVEAPLFLAFRQTQYDYINEVSFTLA